VASPVTVSSLGTVYAISVSSFSEAHQVAIISRQCHGTCSVSSGPRWYRSAERSSLFRHGGPRQLRQLLPSDDKQRAFVPLHPR
jgi:hypothetical protein